MEKLDKTAFANKTTRLLSGKNRITMVLAAFVLLAGVGVAGILLASRASDMRQELMKSAFVESLTAPDDRVRVAQLLGDRENSELLMKYLNSMGAAVENLEISPKWRLSQFTALLGAAREAGAKMEGFSCDPQYTALEVSCRGGLPEVFLEAIGASGEFSRVEFSEDFQEVQQTYTIRCTFT